ncbi:uncharacterized protein ASCRUDRAFT_76454 [Ascoidea rubescens DSM 1968]|uniref:Uncharacterized protein n=1 Tax=Ascoidea rubescens DSM 1968 TaxID=1344418 RepID=A0A1D2VG85_9ASCO|nr:hypothetical protein ASCRUDRAFT_76454 [Ascoidea rubescens DSM 1968]ODV60477.1 hypothetical protein ASCRUDRAFT_76454 [Ascoidea rubescens DSM 1968]
MNKKVEEQLYTSNMIITNSTKEKQTSNSNYVYRYSTPGDFYTRFFGPPDVYRLKSHKNQRSIQILKENVPFDTRNQNEPKDQSNTEFEEIDIKDDDYDDDYEEGRRRSSLLSYEYIYNNSYTNRKGVLNKGSDFGSVVLPALIESNGNSIVTNLSDKELKSIASTNNIKTNQSNLRYEQNNNEKNIDQQRTKNPQKTSENEKLEISQTDPIKIPPKRNNPHYSVDSLGDNPFKAFYLFKYPNNIFRSKSSNEKLPV